MFVCVFMCACWQLAAIMEDQMDLASLEVQMRDKCVSNPIIEFLRMATSWEMRKNPGTYAEVVSGLVSTNGSETTQDAVRSLREYCISTVEAMGEEADQCELMALSQCLNAPLEVESVAGKAYNLSTLGDLSGQGACLLYRAGHYDILYKAR
mmetsp:Transcript_26757/g.75121  ORF Transcript_26757/g.75121 Transcript_26757/m.75121 type:complete len:152 (+) Transcript_26757:92-547(+)